MRTFTIALCVAIALVTGSNARAERCEHRAGAFLVGVLPTLAPSSRTEAVSAGPGLRFAYAYGMLHHRLQMNMQATVWTHGGDLDGYTYLDADRSDTRGTLRYRGEGYRGELGLSWQVISGYSMAPYLRLTVGYQWITYRDQNLLDESQNSYGLDMADTGESSVTLGAGISLERRFFDAVLIGISADLVRATSQLYRGDLSVSLITSYYWF